MYNFFRLFHKMDSEHVIFYIVFRDANVNIIFVYNILLWLVFQYFTKTWNIDIFWL